MSSATQPPAGVDAAPENGVRVVWALAWPAVLLNSFQVVNSLLDRGFVGRLDASAVTAQSASIPIIFLMISLSMSLSTAATALVSRAFGAGQPAEYRTASTQCLRMSVIAGLALGAVTVLTAGLAARGFLPATETVGMRMMASYLLVFAAGLPAFFIIQSLAGSLRGVGDTKSPMVISGLQILLHILLNYLLIFPPRELAGGIRVPGFDLGLQGAAISLSASAWVSALIYLAYMGKTPLGECNPLSPPRLDWAKRILKIAMPAALMAVLRVSSLAVLTLIVKGVPTAAAAIAAMGISFSIEGIMFMPAFGFSVAAAALVGQSLGMKRPDRAERLGWAASHMAAVVVLLLVVPIFLFAEPVASIMTDGKEAIAGETATLLRYLCSTEVMFAYAMVTIGALQGAGDTVWPMWITIIAQWLMRVPMAYIFAFPLGMGSAGVWLSFAISQAAQGVLAIAAFRQGRWKLKEV